MANTLHTKEVTAKNYNYYSYNTAIAAGVSCHLYIQINAYDLYNIYYNNMMFIIFKFYIFIQNNVIIVIYGVCCYLKTQLNANNSYN